MNKIKILPDSVSNKIAAGEVIERPASVVKELIENSLDAGADKIKVMIEDAGIKLIAVSDNGCGMSTDDAFLCIEPHATSKIKNAEDIMSISTLGFRGEALPSIASVSRFRLRTKTEESFEGTEIVVDGGKVSYCGPAGCAKGTEILVKELFFNIPARRKFLSSLETEEKHVSELLYTVALANFAVSFEFHSNGREVFSSSGDDVPNSRLISFFGKSFFENLVPVDFEEGGIRISGFTAKHGLTRSSRREQRIFVNGRPVDSAVVYAGIKEAYSSLVPHGRFPPLFIFINTNPARVDVNVHPAKRELRFREPSLFRKAVEKALRESLRNSQSSTLHLSPDISFKQLIDASFVSYDPVQKERLKEINRTELPLQDNFSEHDTITGKVAHGAFPTQDGELFPQLRIIGVLDDTYILASSSDGLVIIDQHAAHERILFEKLSKAAESQESHMQKLLLPVTMEMSGAELNFISKNLANFEKLGFELEKFGGNTLIAHAIPSVFPQENVISFIREVVDALSSDNMTIKPSYIDIAREACSSAVKARDRLKMPEINSLIRMLSQCEMPFCCPHGRPTMINISLSELQRRFGRSVEKK